MDEDSSLIKSLLIVNDSPPYSKSNAKEALDLALAAATFDQKVNILFTGDACYQLIADQHASDINCKSFEKMLKALPVFGVNSLYVKEGDLEARGVKRIIEGLEIKEADSDTVAQLYSDADAVIRF